jgi:superfamily I DNA/RNA helicase
VEERFEALVVDEAQDLETGWWEALHWTLVDPFETPVALFLDPAQDIYNRGGDFGLPLPTFPLRTNRRSTRAIVNFAARLGGTVVRHPYGVPEGEEPTVSRYASEQEERELVEGKVRWLLEDQRIPLARITLVGTRRLENSFLGTDRRLWHLTVEPMEDTGQTPSVGALRYSTVQRFKGLESEVVLLVDVDGHRNACSNVNLHVAASRARHRLYVFAHKEARLPTEDVARQ